MNSVEKVKEICRQRKIPLSKLERDLGFSNAYISQLKKGTFPADRLQKIAEYLNVSMPELLEDGAAETKQVTESDIKIALFGGNEEVTDEMWQEALFAVELIKQRHKKKGSNESSFPNRTKE